MPFVCTLKESVRGQNGHKFCSQIHAPARTRPVSPKTLHLRLASWVETAVYMLSQVVSRDVVCELGTKKMKVRTSPASSATMGAHACTLFVFKLPTKCMQHMMINGLV